jgi:hypothetical protein
LNSLAHEGRSDEEYIHYQTTIKQQKGFGSRVRGALPPYPRKSVTDAELRRHKFFKRLK